MKKLELLVKRARTTIDDSNGSSIPDYEIMNYFNDAQRSIQAIVYSSNQNTGKFSRLLEYPFLSTADGQLPMPRDAYMEESVNSLSLTTQNNGLYPLDRIDFTERSSIQGYSIEEGFLYVSQKTMNEFLSDAILSYVYSLPTLSYQAGVIETIDLLNNKITLALGYKDGFNEEEDYITICDYKGNTNARYLYIVDFDEATRTLTLLPEDVGTDGVVRDLSAISVGDIISIGEYSTTHSELPNVCETLLTSYVQRRCLARLSSTSIDSESVFTSEEQARIGDIFADSSKAPVQPMASDIDFLGY